MLTLLILYNRGLRMCTEEGGDAQGVQTEPEEHSSSTFSYGNDIYDDDDDSNLIDELRVRSYGEMLFCHLLSFYVRYRSSCGCPMQCKNIILTKPVCWYPPLRVNEDHVALKHLHVANAKLGKRMKEEHLITNSRTYINSAKNSGSNHSFATWASLRVVLCIFLVKLSMLMQLQALEILHLCRCDNSDWLVFSPVIFQGHSSVTTHCISTIGVG